jgi:hypothetical protein
VSLEEAVGEIGEEGVLVLQKSVHRSHVCRGRLIRQQCRGRMVVDHPA